MAEATRSVSDLRVKLFADGASIDTIKQLSKNPIVKGFTTNPTLMKQAGVTDYLNFARSAIEVIDGAPISLEVFSDEFIEMRRQALKLNALASNVYVKIPITNTKGESAHPLVEELSREGVKVNVTAIFTLEQIDRILPSLENGPSGFVSIFAGRIADAGIDPIPTMKETVHRLSSLPNVELIWASPREVLNVVQADECGCHVITVTHDLLKKTSSLGKDLLKFSLETVAMFANDAENAGFTL